MTRRGSIFDLTFSLLVAFATFSAFLPFVKLYPFGNPFSDALSFFFGLSFDLNLFGHPQRFRLEGSQIGDSLSILGGVYLFHAAIVIRLFVFKETTL